MTISQVIGYVNEIKPNTFTDALLLDWINDISAKVQTEIMGVKPEGIRRYTLPEDLNTELELPKPFDEVYALYVEAQVDFAQQEIATYNNTMVMFNAAYKDAKDYYVSEYDMPTIHIDARL